MTRSGCFHARSIAFAMFSKPDVIRMMLVAGAGFREASTKEVIVIEV